MSGFTWTGAEVLAGLDRGAAELLRVEKAEGAHFSAVSTDTRSLRPGDLYVALVGDRLDGHDFVERAIAAGAGGVVVSRDVPAGDVACFQVDDTLLALGDLAAHRRLSLTAPVVGLTGSSGKTTTKEFLKAACETERRVHATAANLNNRIGVPHTLLAAPAEAEVVIVEMGTSEPGEIARLAEITQPDLALLITVSESHLDRLGSFEGVLTEKLDILRGRRDGGASLVGDTPAELPEAARAIDPGAGVVGNTDRADAALRPRNVRRDAEGRVSFDWNGEDITLALPGDHVAYDAWLALAAAEWLGVPTASAARGLQSVQGHAMRNEVREFGLIRVILDCYNANPQSTEAAVATVAQRPGRTVALLGSMLELGDRRDALHRRVLESALNTDIDAIFATGDFVAAAQDLIDERLHLLPTPSEAFDAFRSWAAGESATVLLKGSRGVRLESLVPAFEDAFGSSAGGEA